jgi:hypothetical protein
LASIFANSGGASGAANWRSPQFIRACDGQLGKLTRTSSHQANAVNFPLLENKKDFLQDFAGDPCIYSVSHCIFISRVRDVSAPPEAFGDALLCLGSGPCQ